MKPSVATTAMLMAAGCAWGQVTPETPGWFPFDMPGLAAPPGSPADLSAMNTEPAGAAGFVRIADGRFVDAAGRRLRLYGTNLTGDSCFPEPEQADALARRLRQYGFNVVRLHFMDYNRPGSIWADADAGTLDDAQLARLDRLIAACAANGIYTNINLHVARSYPGQPEVRGTQLFTMGKSLDRWYEPYVAMQEAYARALLGRVNHVTGRRYAEDPAIACVEINNENTLIGDNRAEYRALPAPWRDAFEGLWTAWLRQRHGTTEALRQAWNRDVHPLGSETLGERPWIVQNADGAESTLSFADGVWRWEATRAGTASWNLQMQYKDLSLVPGRYTLSFRARSPSSSTISHSLMLDRDPWGTVGLGSRITLTPDWQEVTITSLVTAPPVPGPLRLNVSLGNVVGTVEFAGFSLRPGGGVGLPPGETLETGVRVPGDQVTDDVRRDYLAFLVDQDMRTTARLVRLLKAEIGCRMPVSDTQVTYGGAGGVLREATLSDYIDIHGYWEHPSYTRHERGWVTAFRIPNTTQTAAVGGTLTHMALHRVRGFPLSVSEYNVPAPNDHGAELFPMLALMAAFQDWDALYSYTYRDFGKDYENTAIKRYFHLIGRASVLVHVPFGAHVFRQAAVAPLPLGLTFGLPRAAVPELVRDWPRLSALWASMGVDAAAPWFRRVELVLTDAAEPSASGDGVVAAGLRHSSDGRLAWHPTDPAGAWLSYHADSAALLVGHVGGRSFDLGGVRLAVAARDWPRGLPAYACITLTALDGLPLAESRRILLAASARTENQRMAWNADRTSLEGQGWGEGPTLSEAVPLTLDLPGAPVAMRVLDANGQPRGDARTPASRVDTRPADQTLWYLLERP